MCDCLRPVNPTEYSEDNPNTVPFQPPETAPTSPASRAGEIKHRYIELPVSPERLRGPRNLAWGVILLALAAVAYWLGLYLAGHTVTRLMVASFGTFGLLWILYKLRVLRQRHGTLMAVGMIALFSTLIPFIERGFITLDKLAKTKLSADPAADEISPPPRGVPGQLPRTIIPPPPDAPSTLPEDTIVRELITPPPDPTAGRLVRIKKDTQVTISGRKFLIRAGREFRLKNFADGSVTFLAGELEVTMDYDPDIVTFTGKSRESPEEITKLAMAELKRRYPAVFEPGTPENALFVERKKALDADSPDFFNNPRWPIELGDDLAAEAKWTRADESPDAPSPEKPKAAPSPGNPPPPPEN